MKGHLCSLISFVTWSLSSRTLYLNFLHMENQGSDTHFQGILGSSSLNKTVPHLAFQLQADILPLTLN